MNTQQVTGADTQLRLHQHCSTSSAFRPMTCNLRTSIFTCTCAIHNHCHITQGTTGPTGCWSTTTVQAHTHTLLRAVGFKWNLSITSHTTSACPLRAAQWTMVFPKSSDLWSSESIFGAKYSMVLTWPPRAAKCRALRPTYRQNE